MYRLSEKLLAVLLTLLLGLSPLQGASAPATAPALLLVPASMQAMAGFAAFSDQELGVHLMSDTQGGRVMDIDPATHDCEQCNAEAGCNGHSCSSGQCTSCALAMLPIFSHPINLNATFELLRVDNGFVSQLSSSLFRPPRA